jgi:hypothetical protein
MLHRLFSAPERRGNPGVPLFEVCLLVNFYLLRRTGCHHAGIGSCITMTVGPNFARKERKSSEASATYPQRRKRLPVWEALA